MLVLEMRIPVETQVFVWLLAQPRTSLCGFLPPRGPKGKEKQARTE